jgi:integrase
VPGPAIFTTETGALLDHANVARGYRRLLRRAGLGRSRLYDLRHSFACHLLADGAPVTYVAEQMGHASPTTTLTWYARWLPSGDRRWIEQLEASRSGGRPATVPPAANLSHAGTRSLADRLTRDPGSG